MKLSPFVLAVAVFGASATAFTFVVLLFVVLALYCMQQLVAYQLGLGRVAAVGACIVWLLTGFGASDVNSATGAPYVLFPVLLYALLAHSRKGGAVRLLAAVAAFVAFLLTTFVSTQLLMLVLVYAVVLVVDAPRWPQPQSVGARALTIARRHLVIPVAAVCVSAYVWLPNLVVLFRSGSGLANYGARSITQAPPLSALKILTSFPVAGGPWFGYVGIVPVLVIAGAWPRARGVHRRLLTVTAALGLFALALHVGVPGVRLIGDLPGFRAIRQDYWAALAGGAESIAVGVALGTICRRGVSKPAVGMTGAFLALWLLGSAAGSAVTAHAGISTLGVAAATAVVIVCVVLAFRADPRRARRRGIAIGAVCLIGLELFAYQNHARLTRFDAESPPPRYVAFLADHLDGAAGDRILDAGRAAVYPEWGAALGIPQVESLNVSQIPAYRDFFHRYIEPSQGLFLELGSSLTKHYRLQQPALDLLSVRYIVVDGSMPRFDAGVRKHYPLAFDDRAAHVKVYENPHPLPRAFLSPLLARTVRAPLHPFFAARLAHTADPTLLSDARAAGIPKAGTTASVPGTARITHDRNTEVRVRTEASKPSVLVLTDVYADGWHVTVNGKSQHLAQVDQVMRGVVVPAGASTVVFTYRSASRSIGALISIVSLALLLGYAAMIGWRSRRARRPVA
jgi:hypothetical protein